MGFQGSGVGFQGLVDVELLTDEHVQPALELCSETGRMLNGLLARLRDTMDARPLKPNP